jgi:hypothetical protein
MLSNAPVQLICLVAVFSITSVCVLVIEVNQLPKRAEIARVIAISITVASNGDSALSLTIINSLPLNK